MRPAISLIKEKNLELKMNIVAIACRFLLVLGFVMPCVAAADWLYFISKDSNQLQRVDTNTFELQLVGTLGFDYRSGGMAWDSETGKLIMINDPSSAVDFPVLYLIDPLTGGWEILGTIELDQYGKGRQLYGLEYIAETRQLLVAYDSRVVEVDRNTLSSKEVANSDSDDTFVGLAYNSALKKLYTIDSSGNSYLVNSRDDTIKQDCNIASFLEGGVAYDSTKQSFWQTSLNGVNNQLYVRTMAPACSVIPRASDVGKWADNLAFVPADDVTFGINATFNDAWFNPATPGQGFMIAAFPNIKQVFLTWFTFDVERPPEDVTAMLGDPGHRWLTAQGPYEGDTANLTVFVTSGGVFDSADPPAITDQDGDGTITLQFSDCENGLIDYDITSLNLQGLIPIERIVLDNVTTCENSVER